MGFWDYAKRGGLAVATGGLSELGGARTLNDAGKAVGAGDLSEVVGLAKPAALGTVQGEISENDQRRQQYANDLANYQNRTAPQLGQASTAAVPMLAPQVKAEMPQAPTAQRAAGTVGYGANQASAAPVAQTQIAPTATYDPATLGAAHQAAPGTASTSAAQAGQVNTGGQLRADQMEANALMKGAAVGNAPSVAEEQLKRGMASNVAAQYALAKSGGGGYGQIAALEHAQDNAAAQGAEMASRTAELRAGEMAQARGQYVSALAGTRGQDIGAETTNAQLGTQVSLANAGMATDVSKANAAAFTQAGQFNAAAQNTRDFDRARFVQDAAQWNAGAQNQRSIEQARLDAAAASQTSAQGTDVSKFNAGAGDTMNRFNETNRQQNEQFNADLEAKRQAFVSGMGGQINMYNAGQANDLNKFGVNTAADIYKFNAGQQNDMTRAQADFDTRWAAMDDAQKRAYMQYINESQGMSISGANTLAGNQQAANDSRWSKVKDFVNTAKDYASGQAIG